MYSVFTRLGNGEFLLVASFEELKQALQLVKNFNENFPHEYLVRDPDGKNVELKSVQ